MKKQTLFYCLTVLCVLFFSIKGFGQVTTGVFGGDAATAGYPNESNTSGKWIKIAEMILDGAYKSAGFTVDFFPRNSNHGDAHERLNVQFRTKSTSDPGLALTTSDIALIHFSGQHHTVKDVKVVRTSGTGNTNNQLSVWVQMGISWLLDVPIEIRKYDNVTVYNTNQPYYSSITESGETYSVKTRYSFKEGLSEFDGAVKTEKVIVDPEAWPDYVFDEGYQLNTLEEVEAFIKANGHLPNIAPADTFLTNGLSLGDMDVKLLEKIEELTLYTIEQEKQIKMQNALLQDLLNRVKELEQ